MGYCHEWELSGENFFGRNRPGVFKGKIVLMEIRPTRTKGETGDENLKCAQDECAFYL